MVWRQISGWKRGWFEEERSSAANAVGGDCWEECELKFWSTGRELNPRILVLQTSALATSPPVLV